MTIPILDLKRQYEELRPELEELVLGVLRSGRYILGPLGERLEAEISGKFKAGGAVSVASGSDALLLSLMAAGVGPGDRVLTTPYSFFSTVSSIVRLGARPCFVDVTEDFLVDVERVPEALSNGVKAFIPVHLFGRVLDLRKLLPLLRQKGIVVIEDTAQAIGAATEDGAFAGSMGDYGALSFYPTKNLGAAGDAGMILVHEAERVPPLKLLRNHGSPDRVSYPEMGVNSRLDEIQAAVLLVKLERLDRFTRERWRVARRYADAIENPSAILPDVSKEFSMSHVFHQFVIRHPERDALQEALSKQDIQSSVFYPLPLHLQPCFAPFSYQKGDFPVAERLAGEALALPIFPEMEDRDIDLVASVVNDF